jgi:OOP family OmpA-OmpF porin
MFKITTFFSIKGKIKSFVVLVFMLMHFGQWQAQNLIPDSSFESNAFIPTNFSEIGASKSWSKPSWGTSDLFCKCSSKKRIFSLVNVPENLMGYQHAHSGTCYGGLFAFSHGHYREYLQTHLSATLEKDKYYLLTMYVSLADYSRATVDQLGVCFLSKTVYYDNSNVITDLRPVYIKIENEVGRDTTKWHQLNVVYKSSGGECVLLIGSFDINNIHRTKVKAPKNVSSRINQRSERDSYYFIDDVSLIETQHYYQMDSIVNIKQILVDTTGKSSTLILKNILFETNDANLLPISYSELDIMVEYLNRNPRATLEIAGHTDNSGNEKQNRLLSENRARSVFKYFLLKSIDESRVNYKGYGSSKPIVSNETPEGRKTNRRVEFIITRNTTEQ